MRIPLVTQLSSKDGSSDKNARMTNTLVAKNPTGTSFAEVRPGLEFYATAAGNGHGIVSFNDELLSVYGSNLVVLDNVIDPDPGNGIESIDTISGTTPTVATGVNSTGSAVVGYVEYAGAANKVFFWTRAGNVMTEIVTLTDAGTPEIKISRDGATVLGSNLEGAGNVWTWTEAGGVVDLGFTGTVNFVNSDCTVCCGEVGGQAFVWTHGSGQTLMGKNGAAFSRANWASEDGSVVVGTYGSNYSNCTAFKWSASVFTSLGTLGGTRHEAYGCSSDGTVITGVAYLASTVQKVFRWTSGGGMVSVDPGLAWGALNAPGYLGGCSEDGTIVVGYGEYSGDIAAFKWTAAGGIEYLGTLGGGYERVWTHSPDCSTVSGDAVAGGFETGFVWTEVDGMIDTEWIDIGTYGERANYPHAVSEDNLVVVGFADNANEAFRWKKIGERFRLVSDLDSQFFDFAQSTL